MSIETALLAALSAVTSALCWAVKVLYARLLKAEATVELLRIAHEQLQREHGEAEGKVGMYQQCPRKQDCPFFSSTPTVGVLVLLCVLMAGCDASPPPEAAITPQFNPECYYYRRGADGAVSYHQFREPEPPPPPDVYSIGGSPGGG